MADNSPTNKIAGIKKAWADPKARKGLLLSGGILVVLGAAALTMSGREKSKAPQAPASASVVAPPRGERDATGETSEKYKKLVVDADKERAEAAKSNPTASVLPSLAGFNNADSEAKAAAAAERGRFAALEQARTAQQDQFKTTAQAASVSNGQQGPNQIELARASVEYKSTTSFLTKIIAGSVQGAFVPIMNKDYVPANGGSGQAAAAAGTAAGASNQAAVAAAQSGSATVGAQVAPIVRLGEIAFGTIDIAMSTDYSGPVSATVRQGKLAGARLMGTKTLEHDALVVKFSFMSPSDGGPALPVNAYAVSLGDARKFGLTGLEGDTDYHVFQRYILPAAVAFTQTYGMTASMTGQTASVGTNGEVGTTTPGLTNEQRAAVALGAAMQPLLADVTKQAQRPITVSLPAQTEIGVMFAADVMPGGKMGAGVPQAVPAAPAGQTAQGVQNAVTTGQPLIRPAYPMPTYRTSQYPASQYPATTPGFNGYPQ